MLKRIATGIAGCALLCSASTAVADPDCKKVRAEIISFATTTDCASPIGLCTAGTIDGNQGLDGTTRFTALTAAPFHGEPPTTLAVTGTLDISTAKGTLSTSDVFNFDTARGVFSSIERITGGTGRYAGASGTLFIGGVVQADGSFRSEVSGTLCTE